MARLKEPSYGGPITDVPRAVFVAEALAIALADLKPTATPQTGVTLHIVLSSF